MFCQLVKIVESVFLNNTARKINGFGLFRVPFLSDFWKVFQDPFWGRIFDTIWADLGPFSGASFGTVGSPGTPVRKPSARGRPEAGKAGSEHGGGASNV